MEKRALFLVLAALVALAIGPALSLAFEEDTFQGRPSPVMRQTPRTKSQLLSMAFGGFSKAQVAQLKAGKALTLPVKSEAALHKLGLAGKRGERFTIVLNRGRFNLRDIAGQSKGTFLNTLFPTGPAKLTPMLHLPKGKIGGELTK